MAGPDSSSSIARPLLFERLASASRVLVAGAGGGFDVYAGLPIAFALMDGRREVHLANLTFSSLRTATRWLTPHVAAIEADTPGRDFYFPERTLGRWLKARSLPSTVYAFEKVGVVPLRAAYEALVAALGLDAITDRTAGSELFINPLMGLYFTFDLRAVAKRARYLPGLESTVTSLEVMERIAMYRQIVRPRPWRAIPH